MDDPTVTMTQALAVRDAIMAQFAPWFEAGTPPVTLVWNHDEHPFIEWESGPSDWAENVACGGIDQDTAVELASMGVDPAKAKRISRVPALTMPAGVHVEPVNSFSLGIYPA